VIYAESTTVNIENRPVAYIGLDIAQVRAFLYADLKRCEDATKREKLKADAERQIQVLQEEYENSK
jgi:cytidylate kinase